LATDRLKIYNGALQICKVRAIASLTVNEEARYELDTVWNADGVQYCLEQGQWLFARRSSKFSYETAIEPQFGYRRAFAKPDDWVNTAAVCNDEYYNSPLNQYADENGYWYADIDEIYVKYTSNHVNYGMNFAKWPVSFTNYVAMYFASKVCGKLSSDNAREGAILKPRDGLLAVALDIARSRDMQSEPARFLPPGSWSRARQGRNNGDWRDGGSRNNLIG
tara:strand:- start:17134 stop:17796 length:663 start_codon:yes stop_codon:yes gene_type:complete